MKNSAKLLTALLALVVVVSLFATTVSGANIITKDDTLTGIAADAENLTYLSDIYGTDAKVDHWVIGTSAAPAIGRDFSLDKNFFGTRVYVYTSATTRYEVKTSNKNMNGEERTLDNGQTYHISDIVLGAEGIKYDKGLGFQPSKEGYDDAYVVFNVSNLDVNTFYAVAGVTGEGNGPNYSDKEFNFEVYGSKDAEYSKDGEWELLAAANNIRAYLTGEFIVNIEGYNFIKLSCHTILDTTSSECAWGNACVYKAAAPETEPSTEPETEPSAEPETEPSKAPETQAPETNAPQASEPAGTDDAEPASPVGLIIGIVAAVLVVAAIVVVVIIKKKK